MLAALLAALLCLPSLRGPLVFDDVPAVASNADALGLRTWWQLLRNDFWGRPLAAEDSHKSYRPLTVATLRLNVLAHGVACPTGFHLVNTALHALVTASVSLAAQALRRYGGPTHAEGVATAPSGAWAAALVAGATFAAHPVHAEAAGGIVGRAELLAALLALACVACYCGAARQMSRQGPRGHVGELAWVLLAVLLAAAAALCKEQGATAIGVAIVADAALERAKAQGATSRRRQMPKWLPGALRRASAASVATAALIVARVRLVPGGGRPRVFSAEDNPMAFADELSTRAMSYAHVWARNAWLLLCPSRLAADWGAAGPANQEKLLIRTALDWRNLASATVLTALAVLTVVAIRSPRRHELAIGLSVLTLPFLPCSNALFPVGFVLAERTLYMPSIGLSLLLASAFADALEALRPSRRGRRALWAAFIVCTCAHTTRCLLQHATWASPEALYAAGARANSLSAKMPYSCGVALADAAAERTATGDVHGAALLQERSRACLRRALEVHPGFAPAANNLGLALAAMGEPLQAIEAYAVALAHEANHAKALGNMGMAMRAIGLHAEGVALLQTAVELAPLDSKNLNNLALALSKDGTTVHEAVRAFDQALALEPDEHTYWNNKGAALLAIDARAAEHCFQRALELAPGYKSAMANLQLVHNYSARS